MEKLTEQDLDASVASMLRAGVSGAALVVLVGAGLLMRHPWSAVPDYRRFQAGDPGLRSIAGVLQGAIDGAPRSIIQCGLLILAATPVARVVLCIAGFVRLRDARYVGISTVVFLILLYSLFRSGQ